MRKDMSVGILGLGSFLPDNVRTNDWWPAHVVDTWRERLQKSFVRARQSNDHAPTDGIAMILDAMTALRDDPFQGTRERRVIPEGMSVVDMEVNAAQRAIEDAGIDKNEIGLVFGYSMCPEVINVPSASAVHHRLGLPPKCISMNTDAVCNAFAMQLTLAVQMIRGGLAKYALLTQSSALSRLLHPEDPSSCWAGDGATAVVVGPVSEGRGFIACAHRTDGSLREAVVSTVPGGHWYSEGRATTVTHPTQAREMFLRLPDWGREIVGEALSNAGVEPAEIGFYASHQPAVWLRPITQKLTGLDAARTIDTFPWAGNLSAANIPLVLESGRREGLLREGDLVATYSGGTGVTVASMVMRWGR